MNLKNVVKEIKSVNVVKSWIKDLNPNTKISYLNGLAEFCLFNNIRPDDMIKTIYQEEEERLPSWERSINKWFEAYDEHCKEHKHTKTTRDNRRTIVNAFISYHDLPTFSEKGKRRKSNGFKESNVRKALKKEDIRKMLESCKTWKMKSLILIQTSSGLSIADILNLKVEDFQNGLKEVYDKKSGKKRKICQFHLVREKTKKEFITFINEEAIEAIETYLNRERIDIKPYEALFTNKKAAGKPIHRIALHQAYRKINEYLGWDNTERGRYRPATSHMMRKFFNTQLVYAGMPEEIREHFMGHTIENKVRDAYFLQNEEELQKVYLENINKITIRQEKPPVTLSEYQEMKNDQEYLQKENNNLKNELNDVRDLINNYDLTLEPNEELLNDNKQLSEALSGVMSDNQRQQSEINDLTEIVKNMEQKLIGLKKASS